MNLNPPVAMARLTSDRAYALHAGTTRVLTALRFAALATLAFALLSGCAAERPVIVPAEGALVVEGVSATVVGDGPFSAGAIADVRFANAGTEGWWHNPCQRTVERRDGDAWVSLGEELRVCIAVVHPLEGGAEDMHGVDIPADAQPDTYRFRFHFMSQRTDGPAVVVPSSSFEVR